MLQAYPGSSSATAEVTVLEKPCFLKTSALTAKPALKESYVLKTAGESVVCAQHFAKKEDVLTLKRKFVGARARLPGSAMVVRDVLPALWKGLFTRQR